MSKLIRDFIEEANELVPVEPSPGVVEYVFTSWHAAAGWYLESDGDSAAIAADGMFGSIDEFVDCGTVLARWMARNGLDPEPLIAVDEAILKNSAGDESCTLQYLAERLLRLDVLQQQLGVMADRAPQTPPPSEKKIKPGPGTRAIIQDMNDGLDNDAIAKKHSTSASNATTIRSRLENDAYEL